MRSVRLSSATQNCHVQSVWYGTWSVVVKDLPGTVTCAWQGRMSTAATTNHCPVRSLSASLPFNYLNQREVITTNLFFLILLSLSFQVWFAWICFQRASPRCHFANGKNIYIWSVGCGGRGYSWIFRRTCSLVPFANNTYTLSYLDSRLPLFHTSLQSFSLLYSR